MLLFIISGPFLQCQKFKFPSKHLCGNTLIAKRFGLDIKIPRHVAFCHSIFAVYCSCPCNILYHVSLLVSERLYQFQAQARSLLYFPARKTHFFPPEKCDLNSTCVLCAEGKYYFQTYKYPYILYMKKVTHLGKKIKKTFKMILVAVTKIIWVSMMNKLYYGC